jgi:hypothetical protein
MTKHVARTLEHLQSQDKDIARRSSVPKRAEGVAPIHPSMRDRVTTTLGAPSTGSAPDASGPLVTDPTRQGKAFPVPAVTQGCKSDPQRGRYDPGLAHAIFDEAARSSDDYARDIHTVLPENVTDNQAEPVRKP